MSRQNYVTHSGVLGDGNRIIEERVPRDTKENLSKPINRKICNLSDVVPRQSQSEAQRL